MAEDSRGLAGKRRLAEGREAEVFEWADTLVLRLLRPETSALNAEREAAALRAAEGGGVRVPHVVERVTVAGRAGVVMERVDGSDLLTLMARRPWRFIDIGRTLGAVHARVHEVVVVPDTLPPLRSWLRQRIDEAGLPGELREFALRVLDDLPDGDRLCHGDFHPGNVLIAGDERVLIDWTNATRGAPAGDLARTALMARLGDLPPGTSRLLRSVDRFGRRGYAWAYRRGYQTAGRVDDAGVQRWQIPQAAARLADGISSEARPLLDFLRTRRAEAA